MQYLPELMTVRQAAEYLDVSVATAYSWVTKGDLPSFKIANTRRIRKEALLAWIAKKEGESS